MNDTPARVTFDAQTDAFYRSVLQVLNGAGLPVLVGGAYAFAIYTGIQRQTKDLDLFVRGSDYSRLTDVLGAAGYQTQLTFPHWLGKVYSGSLFVDIIFNSGNGLTPVEDAWFEHAPDAEVLGIPAKLMPVEEMIASKAFIMERERFDGADVAHLLLLFAQRLDWKRLLGLVGPNWRVLLSHVVLFGFIYPGELARIPAWMVDELVARLRAETDVPPGDERLCRGTLLSREQYLHDIVQEGYVDARLPPYGTLRPEDLAVWTEAIKDEKRG
ncbi:MAG TPA: nucleotidyltransferase [Burkholderiales bacterium]|nr:nucleotidyltransferase [Burkholderiales bacterium]